MAEIIGLLVLLGLLWLAYKVGRTVLRLAGFILSVLVGLAFIAWLFGLVSG